MKIHDKFVIELAEVIKGYGNDYQVKEPFNLPCDYKFYEIEGVAICEKSFEKMTPLENEINKVLDEIMAEIYTIDINYYKSVNGVDMTECAEDIKKDTLKIIDKYRKEKE